VAETISKIINAAVLPVLSLALILMTPSVGVPASGAVPQLHPDGAVGRLAFHGSAVYSTRYSDTWRGGQDFQLYNAGIDLVAHSRLTLRTTYRLTDRAVRRHEIVGGVRLYLKDPAHNRTTVNPDGPVSGLVIDLDGGMKSIDNNGFTSSGRADFGLTMPITPHVSVAAGYHWYEEEETDNALSGWARVTWYPAVYRADSAWANPDGPGGQLVVRLTGGGSSNGGTGMAEILVPLTARATLTSALRIEQITEPSRTTFSAGIGASYYLYH